MLQFIEKYREKAIAVLNGFDRIVFRGILRGLMHPDGMRLHLSRKDVPRRLYGQHVEETTSFLKAASLAEATRLNRPVIYVPSSHQRKESLVREVLREHPVETGLVCVLKCVEPCMTYEMYRNRDEKKLELVYRLRKCLHLYHYFNDPLFGLMHARIQTWYPFPIQVCMNGREWLGRRLDEEGLDYTRYENSFFRLEDPHRAQTLMNEFLRLDWPQQLNAIAARLNPVHQQLLGNLRYYWFAHQTEWATDIVFDRPQDLQCIYPQLVWGAITTFSSRDVMRFLGKQLQAPFKGEAVSHYEQRPEGLRIKHGVNANSVKMYDKGGRILRVETTINNPHEIKVLRPKEAGEAGDILPRPLRKGVADLERRAHVSQRANERYLDALSHLDTDIPLAQLLGPVTKRITRGGKRFRAVRPWDAADLPLLQAIHRPEYLLNGFRNRDIAALLFPQDPAHIETRRAASGRTSYRLRILHAHGLIAKIPRTRRYRITDKGRQICSAILLAQTATIKQLNVKAA
ncbi:MAG TPA: hypothetical protein PLI09_08335 [Candidatus Hydrogenedentes bacterium]|nr:hypothetical protein [Candidatus Hydrogenedentota bacterium]